MKNIDFSNAADYQQISFEGLLIKPGWRRQEPCHLIDWNRMNGKTVLDLACSNGMMSIQAKEAGASRVVGVDYEGCIDFAREVVEFIDLDIEFWRVDLRSTEFLNNCPKFDIVLCCSIFQYIKQQDRFLEFLYRITNEVLYLETNHRSMPKPIMQQIRRTTNFSVELLGHTDPVPLEKAVGHFMIECLKDTQWRDWPITMIPIKKLKLSHDLEGYKDAKYPPHTFEEKSSKANLLANDIEAYGLRLPIWVKELTEGENEGLFRVIEGHSRTFALKILKERGREFDAPCKLFPTLDYEWIRSNGFKPEDYIEIYERDKKS